MCKTLQREFFAFATWKAQALLPKRHYRQCHDQAGRSYMIPRPFGLITRAGFESCKKHDLGAAPREVPVAVYAMHNHAKNTKHSNHEDAHVLFLQMSQRIQLVLYIHMFNSLQYLSIILVILGSITIPISHGYYS